MNTDVVIDYTNHRGERRERRIQPIHFYFAATQWHPAAQWLVNARDLQTGELRDFALSGIHSWQPDTETQRP